MKKEINLTGGVTQKSLIFLQFKKRVGQLAVIVLGLFVLASLTVLITFFVLSRQLNTNESKINSLKSEIKKNEKKESYMVTISNRIDTIASLLEMRGSYTKAISDLKLILIPGFVPQTLEIGRDGSLKISGEAKDNQILTKFNDTVEGLAQEGKYSKVVYPSVSKTESGKYNLSLELKR